MLFCNTLVLLCLTIFSSEIKRKVGHLDRRVYTKKAYKSRNFLEVLLPYKPQCLSVCRSVSLPVCRYVGLSVQKKCPNCLNVRILGKCRLLLLLLKTPSPPLPSPPLKQTQK